MGEMVVILRTPRRGHQFFASLLVRALVVAGLIFLSSRPLKAYSVLTHEQIVDLAWSDRIAPLLKLRYPNATEEEINEAHAYAYGGSIIQDLGYYPFGSKDFSNLLHYVRTGDFVIALLRDADNLNDYAFAVGALAHYTSDVEGHPAVNRAVALDYPKLEQEFGEQVTYEDNHQAHIRTEFGFDVVQVAKGRFTSDSYHNFIGFKVSKPLLEQAFRETYGVELTDVLKNPDLAIGTYRRSVSKVIPEMTRVALLTKHAELVKENPDFDKNKFLYRLSRAQYEEQWGNQYERPGWRTRLFAAFVRILPKVGPLKSADITLPTPQTEDMYIKSVNKTVDAYRAQLTQLRTDQRAFLLPNRDCDTGKPTTPSEYRLADETYAKLVEKLAENKFQWMTPPLRANVVAYYSHAKSPPDGISAEEWQKVESTVADLRELTPGR
jgi:hypothetical protein